MSRIDSIKEQLLAERDQLERELAAVNTMLAVFGGEKKAAPAAKPAKKQQARKQSPPSQAAMEATLKAINEADRPLRAREISEITGLSGSLTSKTAAYLHREARIKGPNDGLGYAPGKGKIPLWASLTYTANGDEPELEVVPTAEEQPQQELPVG